MSSNYARDLFYLSSFSFTRYPNAGLPNKCPAANATAVKIKSTMKDNTPASAMPPKFMAYYQKKVKELSEMLSTILIGVDG